MPSTDVDAIAFHPHPVPSMPSVSTLNDENNLPPCTTVVALEIETAKSLSTLHF